MQWNSYEAFYKNTEQNSLIFVKFSDFPDFFPDRGNPDNAVGMNLAYNYVVLVEIWG